MSKTNTRILAAMSLVMASSVASAQTIASPAESVTVDNYNRAQTDIYFAGVVKNGGSGNSGMAASLRLLSSKGLFVPTATHCIRLRYSTSMPGR
jgi:hypothetical protein